MMLFKFRRMRAMDPLQVAMTGVRMGERYLQMFCSDATLTRGLATKTGLSGMAALAAPDDTQAARARGRGRQGRRAHRRRRSRRSPTARLARCDVRHGRDRQHRRRFLGAIGGRARRRRSTPSRRVLRPGGRVEIIERLPAAACSAARPPMPADYAQRRRRRRRAADAPASSRCARWPRKTASDSSRD